MPIERGTIYEIHNEEVRRQNGRIVAASPGRFQEVELESGRRFKWLSWLLQGMRPGDQVGIVESTSGIQGVYSVNEQESIDEGKYE